MSHHDSVARPRSGMSRRVETTDSLLSLNPPCSQRVLCCALDSIRRQAPIGAAKSGTIARAVKEKTADCWTSRCSAHAWKACGV